MRAADLTAMTAEQKAVYYAVHEGARSSLSADALRVLLALAETSMDGSSSYRGANQTGVLDLLVLSGLIGMPPRRVHAAVIELDRAQLVIPWGGDEAVCLPVYVTD